MHALLIIICKDTARVWLNNDIGLGVHQITLIGRAFDLLASGNMFEWLFDKLDNVVGVELCLASYEEVFQLLATTLPSQVDSKDPSFPRIWFGAEHEGEPRCLQDWEDYYYRSPDGTLLIGLRTHMLEPHHLQSLAVRLPG